MDPEIGEEYNFLKLFCKNLKMYWRTILLVVWPIVLLPILVGADPGKEGAKFRCLYVLLIMAGYWMTECTSIYVTGFIPIFMFPLLNIMSSVNVAACYFKEVTMMFMGSLFLASAVEASNLHVRIALWVIMSIGTQPRRLHFAILIVTFFLSMWLMNTAVSAMMCPIVKALQEELEKQGIGTLNEPQTEEEIELDIPPRPSQPSTGYYLGVCYSSTIGGLGTMIGTASTLIYKGLMEEFFPESENTVEFGSWFAFAFPVVLILELFLWLWLQIAFFGMFRPKSKAGQYIALAEEKGEGAKDAITAKYNELGQISWHECWVGIMFCITVVLWTFRKPDFMAVGWANALTADYHSSNISFMKGSMPSALIVFLMLQIPAKKDFIYMFSKDPAKRPKGNLPGLLTWKILQQKTAWGIIFLIGGGFSLASGGNATGMSHFIAEQLYVLEYINKYIVMCATTLFTCMVTEIVGNMACCNVIIPIVLSISIAMKINPILLGHTSAMSVAFAFMLPVGTPANTVIVAYSNARTIDFIKCGSVVKLACYVFSMLSLVTYGRIFWSIDGYPAWANVTISTTMKSLTTTGQ